LNLASNSQAYRSTTLAIGSSDPTRQQFLRFLLQPGLMALIEIDRVTELLNISIDRVVPMPHLPPAVRGVYNWRGEILWIVDLAMLLGVAGSERCYRNLQPTIVLSNANGDIGIAGRRQPLPIGTTTADLRQEKIVGLIVDEIVEIEWCQLDLISCSIPDRLDPELSKWVRGTWESPTGENFLVLDGLAILDRADFHADARSNLNYFFRKK
jgi:positive phototaxis protein PixI